MNPTYKYTTTPSGTVQVSDSSGKILGTGTQEWAQSTYPNTPPPTTTSTTTSNPAGNATASPGSGAVGRYPTGYTPPAAGTPPATDAMTSAENAYQTSTTPEDPAAIASRIQSEYAAEISSIENYYNSLISQQQQVNANESGRTRATASATGELGSDMGNAAQANTDTQNSANLAKITSAEAAAVGQVQNTEAGAIESEISGERSTAISAAQQHISFLSDQSQKAQSQLATVAAAYDLNALPQDLYDSLYEASGFATPDQFNTYYNAARTSAMTGGKTIGDATTGVWQQQIDGTWKVIIPGAQTIGDPTSGVWAKQADGTYKNVIPAQPKIGSIGAAGSYIYNPSTGGVETIKPAAPKIVSSGGIIYAVDPSTQKATQLTTNQQGWNGAKGASGDQEKAAILSYVNSLGLSASDSQALQQSIERNPQAYYTALGNASQAGFYTPTTVAPGTPAATTDATSAATDATDAAANVDTTPSDTSTQ